MKFQRIFFFASLLFVLQAVSSAAQVLPAAQVPAAVRAALQKAYSHARTVQWEKEGSRYEAGFRQASTNWSVLLTSASAGEVVETETSVVLNQLPAPVRQTLARQYSTYRVTETARILEVRTGRVVYEAEVSKAGKHRDALFTADGKEIVK